MIGIVLGAGSTAGMWGPGPSHSSTLGAPPIYVEPEGVAPFFGEWGTGEECGEVGPFDTIMEAFEAAARAAGEHGATALPGDGFAQVKDSQGQSVGPIT